MRLYICAILMALPIFMFGSPISLISESSDALTLSFVLPDYELEETKIGNEQYHQIVMDEGSQSFEEGYPELKVFSVPVAIPIDGQASVRVLSSSSQRVRDVKLAPVATMNVSDTEVSYSYEKDYAAYSKSSLYPEQIVQVSEPAFIGNRRFVSVRVYPFQYSAANRQLTVHDEIEIAVSISGSKSGNSDWQLSKNPLDPVADQFFINNLSSKSWRKPKDKAESYESPKNSTNQVSEIQLIVDSEGIYKVGYRELKDFIVQMTDSLQVQMSWDIDNVDPRYLELSDEYGQVPIHFEGENDGRFNSGDYFEFFGDRHYGDTSYYDDYTAENVYTLRLKDGFGARMVVENGGLIHSNPNEYTLADAYEETLHFEEQLVSDKLGRGWSSFNQNYYREDLWFWKKINAPNLEIVPIELQYPIDTIIRKANTKIVLHGLTYKEQLGPGEYDHEAAIRLNQAMINSHTWTGQTEKIFFNQEPISNSFLRHGTNNVYISLSGNTASADREQVLLDYIEISYWREYKTDQDYIKFTKPKDRPNGLIQFELEGFSSPDVSVYKIGSSKFTSLQIEPFYVDGSAPWTVSLQDSVSSQSVRYYAVEEGSKKVPKQMRLNLPSDLHNPMHAANVIVITPYEFIQAEGTLLLSDIWEAEGNVVKIVDLQDIYDEFNSGIVSPQAIKDFLKYAYNNWGAPELSHVMLLGEGVADTRDNSPSRKYNLIPVKKSWTYKHGATATDTWYGCIVGEDTVPDITVARICIWTPEQILDYALKAQSYRENLHTNRLWNNHITFTAGGKIDDENDIFSQQSERIRRRCVPQDYRVTRVYTTTQTVSPDYFGGTFNLKDAINSGSQYVQFMGHGGGRVWADYNLFNFNDVATLNNQTYPIFLSLACYASAFDTNGANSISEALVNTADKGGIVALGFTGLGYLTQDEDWGLAFNEAAFSHDFELFSEAYLYALARFYTITDSPAPRKAMTDGSAYIGDPLIRLNKPVSDQSVSVLNANPAAGDTLRVQAEFPPDVSAARLYIMNLNEKVLNVPYDLPVINGEYNATYVLPATDTNYTRKVFVAGYSPTKEYIGHSFFGVGRPAIKHHECLPKAPSYADSIGFSARVFSMDTIMDMYCSVRTDSIVSQSGTTITWEDLPMQMSQEDSSIWVTTGKLRKFRTGKELFFKYYFTTADSMAYESPLEAIQVAGPDLFLRDIVFDPGNAEPKLRVKSINIGNTPSITTDLKLFVRRHGVPEELFSTQDFAPLEVNEERWDEIDLQNIPNGYLTLEARVNTTNAFSEWHFFVNTNNYISITVPMNYFSVDSSGASLQSIDNNLVCDVPPGFVSSGTAGIAINGLSEILPLNQPDVKQIFMRHPDVTGDDQYSTPYEIKILDSTLVDTLGFFVSGKRLELTFLYHDTDEDTQANESDNSYKIYRYNDEYQKWILHGGHVIVSADKVSFEVSREGIFALFRNTDKKLPSVDVNVEDQEFTVGGYVAGDGVISLLLSDANGIDVIDNSILLFLDGNAVPKTDYVISINRENISRIPIKYQLDLGRGNHELKVDCRDLNGNFMTREIQFIVNDHFDIVNIGNYPNPVLGQAQDPKNDGRTRFTYILTDSADEVYIKIYTISGRLVKTMRHLPTGVGYHEYPRTVYAWDCKDEQGFILANGTYFYKVVARKGNKKIEKIMKMAILR
ncbi:MAG: C25 family cysteine peptidase [Candidatus Cloacimonadaceae bacterium]|nr:C25 family cysteine peptidase [Candidatus Cloacimonadaceae bacterium]